MISVTRKMHLIAGVSALLLLLPTVFLSHKYYINYSRFSSNITYYKKPLHFIEKYPGFHFDPANWTVYLKSKPLDRQSTMVLDGLKKDKLVRLIVHVNGSLQNLGCTRMTSCTTGKHYDFKRHLRINNPPCCKAKQRELLRHFVEEFQRYNATYSLIGGGVIGWVRAGDYVPYDNDVDMMVDVNFWKSKRMADVVNKMRREYLHDVVFPGRWKLIAYYSKINRNQLDIWPYEVTWRFGRRVVSVPATAWRYVPEEYMLPPRSVQFSGVPVRIPRQPKNYLNSRYGKGTWERELSCHIIINKKCQVYRSVFHDLFGVMWFV